MTIDDAHQAIRASMSAIDQPWRQPLALHRFGDAYNAQALESWHVPELWFDPDNKWLTKTTARGPQVVTGMRGCGKTMLLRALHFHARAEPEGANSDSQRLQAVAADDFLGVYASCQKLLNPEAGSDAAPTVTAPFERLYVAYLRDAIQVLQHLRSIDSSAVLGSIDVMLQDALLPLEFQSPPAPSPGERGFAQFLVDLQFRLTDGDTCCRLKMAPAEAFGHLASVIRAAAPLLADKYVLFLLDDVSTRYLHQDMVRAVISKLLFQHAACAFRITTEAQALQRVLLSPGGSTAADPNRDYEEFNLGNEVYRLLREGSINQNMEFVSQVLQRRGRQFRDEMYRRDPRELLGDVSLEDIASEIADSSASSPARKRVYRGLRALQAVCVGDIGDVVKLYEKILQRANPNEVPVSPDKQSDCFLEHSAGLMHFLNRRDQHTKGLALAFAQAAGELLQKSAKGSGNGPRRLRQYTKLYVRVDAGPDFEAVSTNLFKLLDAGVFVYDGGVPRTKTRDDDPVLQFKLSYRKMLGLASFIGLSDRDRFELSGETLRKWLEHPDEAKDILIASEAKEKASADVASEEDEGADTAPITRTEPGEQRAKPESRRRPRKSPSTAAQLRLAMSVEATPACSREPFLAPRLQLSSSVSSLEKLAREAWGTLVVAFGFEERALVSTRRVLEQVTPRRVIGIHYAQDQGASIRELVQQAGVPYTTVHTIEQLSAELAGASGGILVDTSGLAKPFLFVAVRDAMRLNARVGVIHTLAEQYYPRNEDLRSRGIAATSHGVDVFESIGDVLMGEVGPYRVTPVHEEPAEPERWRALLASASPKNDRLLHLLDARTYDAARILVPPATSERRRIARASAELAASAADSNVGLIEVDTNDLEAALKASVDIFSNLYFGSGANVEIGLTGSKMHAVAFGALASAARISAAWYVSPQRFDMQRFTAGVGETRCFELTSQNEPPVMGD